MCDLKNRSYWRWSTKLTDEIHVRWIESWRNYDFNTSSKWRATEWKRSNNVIQRRYTERIQENEWVVNGKHGWDDETLGTIIYSSWGDCYEGPYGTLSQNRRYAF